METKWVKVETTEKLEGVYKIGKRDYKVYYGNYPNDSGEIFITYYMTFAYRPSIDEIKQIITDLINTLVGDRILKDFRWRGKNVYLSKENQINFKTWYDLVVQGLMTLPLKVKLSEDDEGVAVYHIFENMEETQDFYVKAVNFIRTTLQNGWDEKDSVDYSKYERIKTFDLSESTKQLIKDEGEEE